MRLYPTLRIHRTSGVKENVPPGGLTNMTPMLFSSMRSPLILLVFVWRRLDINRITFSRVFPTGGSRMPHVVFITLF